jgi:hypothetical protein
MEKSTEQIVADLYKMMYMKLLNELPAQTCPLKKAKREWKMEQIKQQLISKINDSSGAK